MFVQFADEGEDRIVAVFACEQDSEVFASQGVVSADDARYLAYVAGLPEFARMGLAQPK